MTRTLLACAALAALLPCAADAQTPPEVTLTRFADCGTPGAPSNVGRFSDTYVFADLVLPFTYSCYLVKHGDDYLVWDTGQPATSPMAPKKSLVEQLATLQLKPEQIKYVGISHYHGDHTGQVASFPQSTLLIGKGDWNVLTGAPVEGVNPAPFANWISGGGKVEPLALDKDVFGDGTVVVLATPGHTPGHHSLLVRLKQTGNVIVVGDLAHFHENYDTNGVPSFNTSRAETLASLDRVKRMAAQLKATVVLQHDPRDISKLPAFPQAAR